MRYLQIAGEGFRPAGVRQPADAGRRGGLVIAGKQAEPDRARNTCSASGVNYTAQSYALSVEALIPGNKQTGSHVGVIAQFHLYFDDLFPNSLGKPIVDWWQ